MFLNMCVIKTVGHGIIFKDVTFIYQVSINVFNHTIKHVSKHSGIEKK